MDSLPKLVFNRTKLKFIAEIKFKQTLVVSLLVHYTVSVILVCCLSFIFIHHHHHHNYVRFVWVFCCW